MQNGLCGAPPRKRHRQCERDCLRRQRSLRHCYRSRASKRQQSRRDRRHPNWLVSIQAHYRAVCQYTKRTGQASRSITSALIQTACFGPPVSNSCIRYLFILNLLHSAAMPNTIAALKAFRDPALYSPSAALRISQNTGQQVFFGHKFKFETVRRLRDYPP